MPRIPETTEPSKVYVGMLIVTCAAMFIGIVALVLEGFEYDWMQKPTPISAPILPKEPDSRKADSTTPRPLDVVSKPDVPNPTVPVVEPAKPEVVTEAPRAPFPTPLPNPPAAVPAPSGPIPSPFVLPPIR